ncbi:MAG: 16S rRNA (cytosine(967)-C(5))-methyltransferase RsmB [Agathobaculum sp.]|uniref:16S rRNA (cytosine(967)-C(5))-methyltransferase RsmB n=1 Tax=Agathobaculum sp. TaxID=2048138 RepID=UPI0025BB868C|nr:16S rRNA (cytosine(967)-C(5))-methyltransferase RsmB [Agathobaculum sp.]MDY3710991.1 16S rRNA (cytosine(967)-C(5))-methyltransferase RsmB [Agathobaculum sp.]
MIDARPRTPRETAAFALFSMAEDGAWSDGALRFYLSRAGLTGRDAALAARLTYGTVQNELLLDWYLRRFSSVRLKKIAPRVRICLRLGLYQLVLLDRIPAHAAVDETVALVKKHCRANERTVAFANAVLRGAARAAQAGALPALDCPDKQSYYALKYSHPAWLVQLWTQQFGEKETEALCRADNAEVPVSVRVNTRKASPAALREELAQAGITAVPHRAFTDILLCSGGDVTALPAFAAGRLTVQDAASALAAAVVGAQPGETVLDCCAAPGGKSFAIAGAMDDCGRVLSCDVYEHKLKRIQEGAARLGLSSIETVLQDAAQPREEWRGMADRVLCDVPCSGLGIIRKKPEIRYKDPAALEALPALQADILRNCARYVKPGGTLVYSTCTILRRENEAVVRAFLAENDGFEPAAWSHPVCGAAGDGMMTLLPHRHDTDGFFIAKMRKKP